MLPCATLPTVRKKSAGFKAVVGVSGVEREHAFMSRRAVYLGLNRFSQVTFHIIILDTVVNTIRAQQGYIHAIVARKDKLEGAVVFKSCPLHDEVSPCIGLFRTALDETAVLK